MPTENFNLLNAERGDASVKISTDVIATVAALAAAETEGVDSLYGGLTYDVIKRYGTKNGQKAVNVIFNPDEKKVNCMLNISIKYGYSIPKTCESVQEKVKSALESMVGVEVLDVKITISDVNVK